MPTFASDYMTSTRMLPGSYSGQSQVYGGGGGGSWGPAPVPAAESPAYGPAYPTPIATPSVPSVPGTGNQGYLAAAVKQKAAPKPAAPAALTQPTYDFSADAQRGTDAMNLSRQVAAMGAQAQAGSSITTAPAGTGITPTTYGTPNQGGPVLTNEELLARYTPEVVQGMYGGNEYATTNAGLVAPDPAMYANPDAYAKAKGTFDQLQLQEQNSEANSQARQYADERNANQAATDEMRRRVQAADSAQQEVARKNASERTALATRLASRGLDPNTDTWAGQQLERADQLDREEQQAAANIASIDMSVLRTQANDTARAALVKRIADIGAARDKIAQTEARTSKAEQDLLLAQARDENYQSQVDYRASEAERKATETGLKEDRNPALIALDEARANKTITDAEYTAGVKTEETKARTANLEARTAEVLALTPAKKAKLEADVKKALARGSGRAGSGGGSANLSKTFFSDASRLVDDLAGGQRNWGDAFNTAKAMYPNVPNEVLDTALGKEKWAEAGAYENRKKSGASAVDALIANAVANGMKNPIE